MNNTHLAVQDLSRYLQRYYINEIILPEQMNIARNEMK